MTGLLLFPLSLLLMLWLFHFDYISKLRIIYAVVMSAIIQVILLLTSPDTYLTIKYTLFLTLLAVAAYTDLKEEKILNINIILLYVAILIGLIFDYFTVCSYSELIYTIKTLLILFIVLILLTLIKGISSGDIPLVLALAYLWPDYIVVVICISSIIFLLYSTPRIYKIHKNKSNRYYVAAAPSFLIAAFLFLIYKQFFYLL